MTDEWFGMIAYSTVLNIGALPHVLSVNHGHRLDIEVVQQARVHTNSGIVKIRLAGGPIRRLAIGSASAGQAEMMLNGFGAPLIGADLFARSRYPELVRLVIGPQRAPL